MKILVTGSNGQLGRELHHVLEQDMPGITTYVDLAQLDLTDSEAVSRFVADGGFTHAVNCAAYTAVDKAESEPEACRAVNVDAISNLAKAAAATGMKVIHISTDYVFDGAASTPYREDAPTNPRSCYGLTKRDGETALLHLLPDSIILRTAWLYSPVTDRNFIGAILRKARNGERLRVVSDQRGTPTYARDLARVISHILSFPQWMPGIYHFTDEGETSWYSFAKAIVELAGMPDTDIVPIPTTDYPTPAVRPMYSVLDKTKIKDTFGIAIPHWRDSLPEAIDRIINN